jgi:plastocyanin
MIQKLAEGNCMRNYLVLVMAIALPLLIGADKPSDKSKPQRLEVSITNLQFKPATLKIHVGDTVVWTNNDDRDHTVVATKNGPFKSDNLKAGQTFEFIFPKAGKFPYGCSYHPRMKGEIDVE